jgi:di/tricarboxylate transporter
LALAPILLITMILSDLMNDPATAAAMCPIAVGTQVRWASASIPI